MLDLPARMDLLARADREIVEGGAWVHRQAVHVQQLRAAGKNTHRAEVLLREMKRSLNLLREIRAEILRGIDQIEISTSHRP